MNRNTLVILLVILLLISMAAKAIIHWHLHKKNGHTFTSYAPIIIRPRPIIMFPYTKSVSEDYKTTKLICNVLWAFYTLILIPLLIIAS
jgi:hypothetical protein